MADAQAITNDVDAALGRVAVWTTTLRTIVDGLDEGRTKVALTAAVAELEDAIDDTQEQVTIARRA